MCVSLVGVVLKGHGQASLSFNIRTVTFEDVPAAYKSGIPLEGKVNRLTTHITGMDGSKEIKQTDNHERIYSTTFVYNFLLTLGHLKVHL